MEGLELQSDDLVLMIGELYVKNRLLENDLSVKDEECKRLLADLQTLSENTQDLRDTDRKG